MKQQFPGLQHCKCGMSWKRDIGFFGRTPDMVFALKRVVVGKKVKNAYHLEQKSKLSVFINESFELAQMLQGALR